MVYQSILILLSNLFIDIGILCIPKCNFVEMMVSILNTMFFRYSFIGGAAWFILALIVTSGMFGILLWGACKCKNLFFRKREVCFLMLVLSVWCCIKDYQLKCYGELAFLLQHIIGCG